ncbi:MAG: type VII toxin-antitoxin system HepT family RNase toxin [Candidatus Methanospirareceae archaeon]
MFDEEGVIDHLRELNESLKDWERYQSISLEELHTDRDKRNMVLHAMLISIQSAIDIANHIIADKGLRKPSTYRESFEILYEERLIPKVLSDRLSDLAGFRNILVHIYLRLDIDAVYEVLQRDLSALKEYERAVKRLLQGGGTG